MVSACDEAENMMQEELPQYANVSMENRIHKGISFGTVIDLSSPLFKRHPRLYYDLITFCVVGLTYVLVTCLGWTFFNWESLSCYKQNSHGQIESLKYSALPHLMSPFMENITPQECSDISESTYDFGDATFDILCDTAFTRTLCLQVTYTTSFTDCINACINWESTTPCVGIQWEYGTNGPEEGSLCTLFWNMTGNEIQKFGIDTARLRTGEPVVCQSLEVETHFLSGTIVKYLSQYMNP